ncbi:MAG: type II toxin-antitoxin system VapC family toxin [Nitrospirae bacterium]|nr:type II toxin-antitoxin system VapC family toxin [Nitrospirota bacterium]
MDELADWPAAFCDAGFLIALYSKKDRKHRRAVELFRQAKTHRTALYTTWFLLGEALTLLRYQYGYAEANALARTLNIFQIVPVSEHLLHQALAVFVQHNRDKRISFEDALSYTALTTELDNIPALSFDRDFRTLGLTVIS